MSQEMRRSFSREFKLAVVGRLEAGESGSALALESGVKRTIIYRRRPTLGLFRCGPSGTARTWSAPGGLPAGSDCSRPGSRANRGTPGYRSAMWTR